MLNASNRKAKYGSLERNETRVWVTAATPVILKNKKNKNDATERQ